MHEPKETIFDFDRTVGTEDRFAIRRFISNCSTLISQANKHDIEALIADGATVSGITEFPLQKKQAVDLFYKKFFGRRHNFISFPKMKLSFNKFMFHLSGSYEEYEEGILSGYGTIELALIKKDEKYQLVDVKFFPRMLKQESI